MPYDSNEANLKRLKKSYSEAIRRTVFFVGAGSSTEVGMPNWYSLANGLFNGLDDETPSAAQNDDLLQIHNIAKEQLENCRLWEFFESVQQHWPQLYNDYLSEIFSDDKLQTCEIPSVYRRIWRMRNVGQIMTINIDGLVRRAYVDAFGQNAPQLLEFLGTNVIDSKSYFSRNYPVVLNLHGIYTQRTTWVMNAADRAKLFSSMRGRSYFSFLRHVFESYNIVFVGVNIRDNAISPVIEAISESGLLQDHYWIVPDISADDYRWAQKNNVRTINYTPEKTDSGGAAHSTVVCSILDEVEEFKSFDRDPILPQREIVHEGSIPNVERIIQEFSQNPISTRKNLDSRIEELGRMYGFEGKQVSGFCKEYSIPIEIASVLGTNPPFNQLDNLVLTAQISSSNSSNVWLARESEDQPVLAVKSLSGQAIKDPIERESFRRGIESLYQLSGARQSVAPKYHSHTNIPLSVAMEFIEGASLVEILSTTPDIFRAFWLETSLKISNSLLACHLSEGEVLHRDLKPKNIMFEGVGVYPGCDFDDFRRSVVRFINFDISWHKFSVGNTKPVSADELGYYAPEQRGMENSDTPRSTKTDIYMLGMVLLYLITEEPPPDGGAKVEGWKEHLRTKVGSRFHDELIRNRLARLLFRMTKINVDDRPDLRSIISELDAVGSAERSEWRSVDPDLFVEKTMTELGYEYTWDDKLLKGLIETPRQIELSLSYQHRGQRINLNWMRQQDTGTDRRGFAGRLGRLSTEVNRQLKDYGWQVDEGGAHYSRSISADIKHKLVVDDADDFFKFIKSIVGRLMMDNI